MKALIIGLGQDGRLMAELMQSAGIPYRVLIRRSSSSVSIAMESGIPQANLFSASIVSTELLVDFHRNFEFTHVFNFAANSFVQDSGDYFRDYINANSGITWELLKLTKMIPDIWLLQPLSCEILNTTPRFEDDLSRCIAPRNAYGLSKLVDLHSCEIERKQFGLKILSPIVYNHESRYRPRQFFSRKVISFLQERDPQLPELRIFNCASLRDWGNAREFMEILLEAAKRQLTGSPLLGTGQALTVETFVDHALNALELTAEKQIENGLLKWISADFRIVECSRDEEDAARFVIANRDMVERFFGRTPQDYGEKLVHMLAKGDV